MPILAGAILRTSSASMRLSVFIFVMQILAAAVLLAGVLPPGASAGFAVPPRTQFELERSIRDLRGSSDIVRQSLQ